MAETCVRCGYEVCSDRAEFLVDCGKPITCLNCSTESHKVVMPMYSSKTCPDIVIVGSDPEAIRRAVRANRRAR
jgi:hypothetical protein